MCYSIANFSHISFALPYSDYQIGPCFRAQYVYTYNGTKMFGREVSATALFPTSLFYSWIAVNCLEYFYTNGDKVTVELVQGLPLEHDVTMV